MFEHKYWSPLGYAMFKRNLDIVTLLVLSKVDLDQEFDGFGYGGACYQWKPLNYAFYKEKLSIIR